MRAAVIVVVAAGLAACGEAPPSTEGSREPFASARAAAAPVAVESNPRVPPGLVPWHADFDVARAAAARSGRPVLLFAMLGELDRELC